MIRSRPLATPAAEPVAGVTPAGQPPVTLTRRTRDALASIADGSDAATVARAHGRYCARHAYRISGGTRSLARQYVTAYDALTRRPVLELSPLHPARRP